MAGHGRSWQVMAGHGRSWQVRLWQVGCTNYCSRSAAHVLGFNFEAPLGYSFNCSTLAAWVTGLGLEGPRDQKGEVEDMTAPDP